MPLLRPEIPQEISEGMHKKQDAVQSAILEIQHKANEFRSVFGDEARACCLEWAIKRLRSARADESQRLLDLDQAAFFSGYSKGHLARMVREGRIPDLRKSGSRGRIRIRVRDLPKKPLKLQVSPADDTDSPAAPTGARSRKWRRRSAGRGP